MAESSLPIKCSVCKGPVIDQKTRPFCSARCANVDLGRWLTGSYAVQTEETPENPENMGD